MFFGWGRKSKKWKISGDQVLMVTWRYFHIFFCPLAFDIHWHILGNNRSDDHEIPHEDVKKLFHTDAPDLNFWQRYGLIALIVVCVGISLFTN